MPRVCFYFCSNEQNSELSLKKGNQNKKLIRGQKVNHMDLPQTKKLSLLLKGSGRNSESLLLFLFHALNGVRVVSLPLKGSEGNSKSLLVFLFHGREFQDVFSSAEGFKTEFREFSVPGNSRNSVGNNHLFCLFRLLRNYFLSEIPNPSQTAG
jgi:hypothetical protein